MAKRTNETTTRRQRWLPYVRDVADRLRLRDWRIDVSESSPNDPTASAAIWVCTGRRWAIVHFPDRYFGESREEQRHSVVHELLHCVTAQYVRAVEGKTADDRTLAMLMEYTIDHLADAVAPLLPLPDRSLSA